VAAKRRALSSTDGAGQVLHRDLKPENSASSPIGSTLLANVLHLLVFLNDKQDMLKLGDFGLSKNLGGQTFTQTYVGVSSLFLRDRGQSDRLLHSSDATLHATGDPAGKSIRHKIRHMESRMPHL
jgi:serine/threonine protein kinase